MKRISGKDERSLPGRAHSKQGHASLTENYWADEYKQAADLYTQTVVRSLNLRTPVEAFLAQQRIIHVCACLVARRISIFMGKHSQTCVNVYEKKGCTLQASKGYITYTCSQHAE